MRTPGLTLGRRSHRRRAAGSMARPAALPPPGSPRPPLADGAGRHRAPPGGGSERCPPSPGTGTTRLLLDGPVLCDGKGEGASAVGRDGFHRRLSFPVLVPVSNSRLHPRLSSPRFLSPRSPTFQGQGHPSASPQPAEHSRVMGNTGRRTRRHLHRAGHGVRSGVMQWEGGKVAPRWDKQELSGQEVVPGGYTGCWPQQTMPAVSKEVFAPELALLATGCGYR